MCSKEVKLHLLNLILKNKNVLFGSFSSTLSKHNKSDAWKEIHQEAVASGVFQDKPWGYIRDAFWPNIKKCTMIKVDNAKRTGSGGGKKNILNEIDEKVLEILSKDAPDVVGLPVAESLEDIQEDSLHTSKEASDGRSENAGVSISKETRKSRRTPFSPSEPKRKQMLFDDERILSLREEKLNLEIENLKKDSQKKDLEIENLKLKNELLQKQIEKEEFGKEEFYEKNLAVQEF